MGYFKKRREAAELKRMSVIEADRVKAIKLIDEVAEVINEKMKLYSLRISKKNRECLAMDILNSLAVEKK